MLLRFGVSNYFSFEERQEFSFVASTLKGRADCLWPIPKRTGEYALPLLVLYGGNASGKTNIIAALRRMQRDVVSSHRLSKPDAAISRTPFALKPGSESVPTKFDIDFVAEGVRYHYGYEFTEEAYVSEWLYSYPEGTRRLIFERRDTLTISFGSTVRGAKRTIASLVRPNSLFLSAAVQNNFKILMPVFSFFEEISFGGSLSVEEEDAERIYRNQEINPKVIDFLTKLKTGVVGFRRKPLEVPDGFEEFQKGMSAIVSKFTGAEPPPIEMMSLDGISRIELAHRASDGADVYFSLSHESAGTRRLLVLLQSVFDTLESGGVLIVDEIDASLHTQAAEAILTLFVSPESNPSGAQLFTTTHDTNLMQSKFVRRDEIWFAEKDELGSTHLYPLTDIHTRETDNIERGYLQGRFGAVPFAGDVRRFLEGA